MYVPIDMLIVRMSVNIHGRKKASKRTKYLHKGEREKKTFSTFSMIIFPRGFLSFFCYYYEIFKSETLLCYLLLCYLENFYVVIQCQCFL